MNGTHGDKLGEAPARRRPHRRLILREIAQRALAEQELVVKSDDGGPDNESGAVATTTTASQRFSHPGHWSLLTSFAGYQRTGVLSDFVGDHVLSGNLLYVLASIGYVWANYSRGYLDTHVAFNDGVYIFLALVFVVDAVLYLYSWQGAWPHPSSAALWADYLNIIASVGYTITACMYTVETTEPVTLAVMSIETAIVALFVADAVLYFYAWLVTVPPRVKRRGCTVWDLDCWANVLNILPATLYLMASIVGMWIHETQRRAYAGPVQSTQLIESSEGGGYLSALTAGLLAPGDAGDVSPGGTYPALRVMSRINVWADLIYLADSLVLCASWWRDLQLELAPAREPGLVVALRVKLRASGSEQGHTHGEEEHQSLLEGDGWLRSSEGCVPNRASIVVTSSPSRRQQGEISHSHVEPVDAGSGALKGPVLSDRFTITDGSERRMSFKLPQTLHVTQADSAGSAGSYTAHHGRPESLSVTSVDVEMSSLAGEALAEALQLHPLAPSSAGYEESSQGLLRGLSGEQEGEGGSDEDEFGYDVCSPCKSLRTRLVPVAGRHG